LLAKALAGAIPLIVQIKNKRLYHPKKGVNDLF
jgi:hypothetical protein